MDFVKLTLAGFDDFLVHFLTSAGLGALFIAAYVRATPYREFALVRDGNVAAAVSVSGALLGFVLPLASAIAHSVNLVDMVIWSLIALVVQLAAYGAARMLLPGLALGIAAGNTAEGVVLAAVSVAIGVLNAASMTY